MAWLSLKKNYCDIQACIIDIPDLKQITICIGNSGDLSDDIKPQLWRICLATKSSVQRIQNLPGYSPSCKPNYLPGDHCVDLLEGGYTE